MENSSSMAMTTSTASRLSRPRSLVKAEVLLTYKEDEREVSEYKEYIGQTIEKRESRKTLSFCLDPSFLNTHLCWVDLLKAPEYLDDSILDLLLGQT